MVRYMAWALLAGAVVVACGTSTDPQTFGASGATTTACLPGEQRACACPGGAQGAQVCTADGTALGECKCPGAGGAGGAGHGGAAVGGGATGGSGSGGATTTSGAGGVGGSGGAGGTTAAGGAGTGGATTTTSGGGAGQGGSGGACSSCADVLTTSDTSNVCVDSQTLLEALKTCACTQCAVECADTVCADPLTAPSAECAACAQDKCANQVAACANDHGGGGPVDAGAADAGAVSCDNACLCYCVQTAFSCPVCVDGGACVCGGDLMGCVQKAVGCLGGGDAGADAAP